ncbi:hypothetical protein [Streptomyces sp. NPDC050287]|uniref:hypothetical protein n=1 Tax=Streptomyces sp. NPDC050287 TaxID=3365608 RepID=UPI0037A6961C
MPVPTTAATLMAAQICWTRQTVFVAVRREMVDGRNPDEVSREVLVLLGGIEEPLSEKVLNYAVRSLP